MLSLEVEIALVAVFVNGEEQDDVKESRSCGWCSFEKKVVVGDRLLLILLSLECCLAAMATAPFRLSLLPPKPTMLLSVDESIPIVERRRRRRGRAKSSSTSREERSLHFFYEFEFVVDDVVAKKRGGGGGGGKTRPVDVVGGCIR